MIAAVGSMGDVAPFTGLGARLRQAGHQVSIATFNTFADRITSCGLEFRKLPGDPQANSESDAAKRWQQGGGGVANAVRLVRLLAELLPEINNGILHAVEQGTDVLLLSQIAAFGGYPIGKALGVPTAGVYPVPIYPTGDFPPIIGIPSLGRWGNRMAGNLTVTAGFRPFEKAVRSLRAELGLPQQRMAKTNAELNAEDWPVLHGYSPSVLPRPADWRPGLKVVGYWWPAIADGWRPPVEVVDFIEAGPPPVFIGFGSLGGGVGEQLSEIAGEALRIAGVRGVLQAGWAGLSADSGQVLTIGELPHEWLFPRMAAVVHHGGAGTTAAALRAGVPAVVVPVAGDQPFWAKRVVGLGAASAALPYKSLTAAKLAEAITTALREPGYRRRATELAARIGAEDGAGDGAAIVESLV